MRIALPDRLLVSLSKIIDLLQHGILENYPLFTFIVSNAPQKLGAKACYARAFKEFEIAFETVPAYKRFLEDSGWRGNSDNIREIFESLPVMDKANYILPYS